MLTIWGEQGRLLLKKFAREERASEIFESHGEEPGLPAGVPLLRGKEGGVQ